MFSAVTSTKGGEGEGGRGNGPYSGLVSLHYALKHWLCYNQRLLPILGCLSRRQILASRSSFWWSEGTEQSSHALVLGPFSPMNSLFKNKRRLCNNDYIKKLKQEDKFECSKLDVLLFHFILFQASLACAQTAPCKVHKALTAPPSWQTEPCLRHPLRTIQYSFFFFYFVLR